MYDLNNRLRSRTRTEEGRPVEVTTFTHDWNGNQLTQVNNGVQQTHTFGDVVQRVDSRGSVIHSYRFDAFGNQQNQGYTMQNISRFNGQNFDQSCGLYTEDITEIFINAVRRDMTRPDTGETVEVLELIYGPAQVVSPWLNMRPNTTYVLEFDYWSAENDSPFLYGIVAAAGGWPEWGGIAAYPTVQSARIEISSDSPEMANAALFFLTYGTASSVYITNIRFYNKATVENRSNLIPNTNPFRFAAEYYDWETGFIYLRARYLNTATGRFLSVDPHWTIANMIHGDNPTQLNGRYMPYVGAILQAGNLYVFVTNNPIKFVDPTGLFRAPTSRFSPNNIFERQSIGENFPQIARYNPMNMLNTAYEVALNAPYALVNSTTVTVEGGVGRGKTVRAGAATVELEASANLTLSLSANDGFNVGRSIGADGMVAPRLGDIGAGGSIRFVNGQLETPMNIGNQHGSRVKLTDGPRGGDIVHSFGGSGYKGLGGGVSVDINISEFSRRVMDFERDRWIGSRRDD